MSCMASLPEQTRQALNPRPLAQQVWGRIAQTSGCEALNCLLLSPFDFEDELNKCAVEAKQREAGLSERLQQSIRSVRLLESISADHEEKIKDMEPQILKLELQRAKQRFEEQATAHAKEVESLEVEVRRLKGLLLQKDEELEAERAKDRPSIPELRAPAMSSSTTAAPVPLRSLSSLKPMHSERDVVNSIRHMRMLGMDGSEVPDALQESFSEMRLSLTAAVDRLALDLYESQAHFLRELLQNADDNTYADGVKPSVRFSLFEDAARGGPFFLAANNEVGLSETDVRSICDISRSSKSGSGTTTGCKGVGWKSVFCVCSAPHVLSGAWRFKFGSQGLGMITPEWIEDEEYSKLPAEVQAAHSAGSTVFYLPLAEGRSVRSIEQEMRIMEEDAAQLLFLRRIKELCLSCGSREVKLRAEGKNRARKVLLHRMPGDAEAELEEVDFEVATSGQVMVALPIVQSEAEPPPQRIFAFLPVRPVGFRFAVHAPFELIASRGDLHRSPSNACLRDSVGPAFLAACQSNPDVASRALQYLGDEPADPFWLRVRCSILEGLRNVACIQCADGLVEPGRCILRGELPAARWVPDDILLAACGASFAESGKSQVLKDLGVKVFGMDELIACLEHMDESHLRALWVNPSRNRILSDIYSSLAEGLRADVSRLVAVAALCIFPALSDETAGVHREPSGCRERCIYWTSAADLHTCYCTELPSAWQQPFVKCLSQDLSLSTSAQALLTLLGMKPVQEEKVADEAVRMLLGQGVEREAAPYRKTWLALAILRQRFASGRGLLRQLSGAVLLPSSLGDLQPPASLRLRSFLGARERLPKGIIANIYAFAGIMVPDPQTMASCAAPPSDLPGLAWDFGWELFFWSLGCVPADPTDRQAENFVEATLGLGSLLSSGDFWTEVPERHGAIEYIEALMRKRTCRYWLSQLPVHFDDKVVTVSDLFLHDVFHSLAGEYLPYMESAPREERVRSILQRLGVTVAVDQPGLTKCIRMMRTLGIEDAAVMAGLYVQLQQSSIDRLRYEEVILVPGVGYRRPEHCCWQSFQNWLLKRCCRLEALAEHYERFGQEVSHVLRDWVEDCPAGSAQQICIAFQELLLCAKASEDIARTFPGREPVKRCDALENLFEVSLAVVKMLADLCVAPQGEDRAISDEEANARACQCVMAKDCFTYAEHRMICVPRSRHEEESDGSGGSRNCRLLAIWESYWSVEDLLREHPSAQFALEEHYGRCSDAVRSFFIDVLGVRPVLTCRELTKLQTHSDLPSAWPSASSGVPDQEPAVREGINFAQMARALPWHSTESSSASLADPWQLMQEALQRLQQVQPFGAGQLQEASAAAAARGGAGGRRATSDSQGYTGPPRSWNLVGSIGNTFSVYAIDDPAGMAAFHRVYASIGQQPFWIPLLRSLLHSIGLQPAQVAFAFDPSGRCVCTEHLFLDLMSVSRSQRFLHHRETFATFWALELAHAAAHQGLGPAVSEKLLRLQNELSVILVPVALAHR
eukprot:TRINITY_DN62472_c0_g1_i1.p1 TRINITY_DN62472_c0_g1~~TRINITY_DN62472_c0_g1_i1.p1  ORF type:complete len:1724 (+),score=351.69 TRINITY_DN62472_c0_g1_i1:677-5173(+)